MWRMPASGVFG